MLYRHWLQVTISLTVVMGIAWLMGVLAFRRELLPVAYVMNIFIAAQGILFFIILVPLSKQVSSILIVLTMWKHDSSYCSCTFVWYLCSAHVLLFGH